jgi:hypothetical protein
LKKIIGIIHFRYPIICQEDVLGHSFNTIINNVPVNITFPILQKKKDEPTSIDDYILETPCPAYVKQGDPLDHWGKITYFSPSQSKFAADIYQIYMEARFDDDVDVNDKGKLIFDQINNWRAQFCKISYLVRKLYPFLFKSDIFEEQSKGTGLLLYDASTTKLNRIQYPIIGSPIKCVLVKTESALTRQQIELILSKIDLSKNIRTEYFLFINAQMELQRDNFRYAILEAATAFELCISSKIKSECEKLGDYDSLYQLQYGKLTLGAKVRLLKSKPTQSPQQEIVDPRNDLFHNGNKNPTREECKSVLDYVEKYLLAYLPDYLV